MLFVRYVISVMERALEKNCNAVAHTFWCGLVLRVLFGAMVLLPGMVFAQGIPAAQTYYIPIPYDDFLTVLDNIDNTGGTDYSTATLTNYISISAIADNTIVYIDQNEDGYEALITNPANVYSSPGNLGGTQTWGDGDVSNGAPPGVTLDGDDVINNGTVLVIQVDVPNGADTSEILSAGDIIASSKPISVVRAGWADQQNTLHAGAVEVFDTSNWGQVFEIPVGTDTNATGFGANTMFEYVGAFIQTATDNTSVTIDLDGLGGTAPTVQVIDQGESIFVDGGISEGATISSDQPVQVDVTTGDIGSTWEARFYRIQPTELWSNEYVNPVMSPVGT